MNDWQQITLGDSPTPVLRKATIPPQGSGASMSGWPQVSLSEVVARVTTKNVDATNQNVLTVSAEHGLIAQESFFTKKVASKDTSSYSVVAPGQFVYNKSTSRSAAYGTVARNLSDEPGIVSPLYFVFEAKDGAALPEYLELALNSDQFFGSLAGMLREGARAHGALNVRLKEFYAATVPLPPTALQQRIVEVIGAVDGQIAALDGEATAAERVRDGLADKFTRAADGSTKPLGELCSAIGSGPSWAAKDESSAPSEGALTVLKITNTRPDGSIDLSELAYVAGLPARTKTIGPSSLVMIRTNGNRARIGNVYLPPEEVHGAAVSAFQFTLDALDVETRDYLYVVLRSPRIQLQMSESASGSTGLGNLAVRWLKTLAIPWPDAEVREVQVESVRAIDAKIAAIRTEADRLRSIRARLLSALLDRTIDIKSAELLEV